MRHASHLAARRKEIGRSPAAPAALTAVLLVLAAASRLTAQEADAVRPGPAPAGAGATPRAVSGQLPDTLRLGLEEAVERATARNEDVLVARAEQARLEGRVKEVRARSLPDLSFDFGYTRNIQTPVIFFNQGGQTQQIQIGSDNDYSFGLSMDQTLLDPSLGPAQSAAKLSRRAAAADVEAARTEVARRTRARYFRVLLDRRLVEVQEKALRQARDRLEQVQAFRKAGTASEFELLTARVEAENIRPRLIEARNRLELNRNRLKRTVGIPLEQPLALTDSLSPPREDPVSLAASVERAMERRSDLAGQRMSVDLQRENLAARKRSDLPVLSLGLSFSRRAASDRMLPPERDFSQTTSASLSFSLPLFDGGSRAGLEQQARASLDRERFRLRQLREQVRLDVQQAARNLRAARQQIEASRANVRRAERALEIAQTRFRNGLANQVELNDAELAVTEARTNHARSLHDYHVARAELRAATGER